MPPARKNPATVTAASKRRVYSLSLKQPWAALLAAGRKTIEVRSWPTRMRGRILIHAARIPDDRPEAWEWITDDIRPLALLSGGIIGEAELIGCQSYRTLESFTADREKHLNEPEWFQPRGLYGFVFCNAEVRPFRALPGNVRFFTVEDVR